MQPQVHKIIFLLCSTVTIILNSASLGVEYNSYFLNSQGISIVSQVACNGNESKLNECTISFSSYYCSSHAGVSCPG